MWGRSKSDVSFVARLNTHWANLDRRDPTVKIVCPSGMFSDKPMPGTYDWGCPNRLWELKRTRRVKLSAHQLLNRNVSEGIVEKDNHARDAMKYLLMSRPEPSEKSFGRRITEHFMAYEDKTAAFANFPGVMQKESTGGLPPGWRRGGTARARINAAAQQYFKKFR